MWWKQGPCFDAQLVGSFIFLPLGFACISLSLCAPLFPLRVDAIFGRQCQKSVKWKSLNIRGHSCPRSEKRLPEGQRHTRPLSPWISSDQNRPKTYRAVICKSARVVTKKNEQFTCDFTKKKLVQHLNVQKGRRNHIQQYGYSYKSQAPQSPQPERVPQGRGKGMDPTAQQAKGNSFFANCQW